MRSTAGELFSETIQKTQIWLNELRDELDQVRQLLLAEVRDLW